MQIITTIGEDTSTDTGKVKHFNLEKPGGNGGVGGGGVEASSSITIIDSSSSSSSNSHIDLTASQTLIDSGIKSGTSVLARTSSSSTTTRPCSPPITTNVLTNTNNAANNTSNSNNVDIINMNSINSLKIEFLVKFVYYIHNVQLFEHAVKRSLGDEATAVASCYSCRCICFKDMLSCYLVLVDYVFNEKLVFNGSRTLLDEYFLKISSPKSNYLFAGGASSSFRLVNNPNVDSSDESGDVNDGRSLSDIGEESKLK